MKLTAVRMTKRGRVALYGDDEFLLSMHPDVFAASGLSVGSEIDGERLAGLAAEAELKKAKERAFSMLSGREYTSSQLRDRLARHVDPEAAGQAVERMEELGLVDDDGYAERYARELSERKHYGLLRIRQELRQKGLSAEQIEWAVSLLDADPQEQILEVLEKKNSAAPEDEAVKRRAYNALLRLGHRPSDVRRALARFCGDAEEF